MKNKKLFIIVSIIFTLLIHISCQLHEAGEENMVSDNSNGISNRIIGGTVATPGEYPWQAVLWDETNKYFCGGSLIATQWVLTAAHCVAAHGYFGPPTVVLGKHDLTKTEIGEQRIAVSGTDIFIHPYFGYNDNGKLVNDIALIRLPSPVRLTLRVNTIKLAPPTIFWGIKPIKTATVTGWRITEKGILSDVLKEAILPIVNQSYCNDALEFGNLDPNEICAGYSDGSIGACHGDSGGPFAYKKTDGTWEQIGIVSWGDTECRSYTVFAKVSSHLGWISSILY